MRFKTYEPRTEAVTDHLGIVLLNHIGSSVSEDTGRDAQILADDLGLQVIAADRPGTGWILPSPFLKQRLTTDYVQEMARLGAALNHEAEQQGLAEVVTAGRSAAGLGAAALTCTETMAVVAMYSVEGPGCYDVDVREGKRNYAAYNKEQNRRLALPNTPYTVPETTDTRGLAWLKRAASIPYHRGVDIYHNDRVWTSSLFYTCANFIARDLLTVHAVIEHAEYSMVLPPELEHRLDELSGLRGPDDESFTRQTIPDTVHSSLDLRRLFAERLRPVVKHALER